MFALSAGLAPRRDGGGCHGLAAVFEAASAPRDPERLAVTVLGRAEVFFERADDRAAPIDVSIGCHDELLDAVQPTTTVACLDTSPACEEGTASLHIQVAVDGLLDKPKIEWDEVVAIVGSARDAESSVDIGDVAGHDVSTGLLRDNRKLAAFDAAAAAVKIARASLRKSFR